MKTAIKSLAAIVSAIALLFSGCTYDPIFASIEQEVKLKDPTLRGSVTSLVAAGGNLYAADGTLYERTGGTGDWHKVSLPAGASRCAEVATDGTNLYARLTGDDWTVSHSVQLYTAGAWTPVTGIANVANVELIGSGSGVIFAFERTSLSTSGKTYSAWVTSGVGSTSFDTTPALTGLSAITGAAGNFVSTAAGVYELGGSSPNWTLTLMNGPNAPTGVTGITTGGGSLYALTAGSVYRWDGIAWSSFVHSVASPTSGISYLETSGKNLLLIASGAKTGGYGEVTLSGPGGVMTGNLEPGASTSSSISTEARTQYEGSIGQWAVRTVWAVTASVPAGNAYVLYASVSDADYNGLWSYYPGTRAEWNRE